MGGRKHCKEIWNVYRGTCKVRVERTAWLTAANKHHWLSATRTQSLPDHRPCPSPPTQRSASWASQSPGRPLNPGPSRPCSSACRTRPSTYWSPRHNFTLTSQRVQYAFASTDRSRSHWLLGYNNWRYVFSCEPCRRDYSPRNLPSYLLTGKAQCTTQALCKRHRQIRC